MIINNFFINSKQSYISNLQIKIINNFFVGISKSNTITLSKQCSPKLDLIFSVVQCLDLICRYPNIYANVSMVFSLKR